ncbi:N-acetylglucosaminyl-diphospho-decaprenol L-rhamnosyltransferase [Sanguibacter gelidistatuariae]|uniref:N-acetylglucosaminyl-diphospho-decaprenol L-rhamnosyltransferase n=1 Tax=Sanguibacter gelidistatuariae TaxID=1814289 RepID=A0A1G6XXS8_9MICO|nr:N-acetylglucosaminyl-diphospho-decaprenol L-rhamnosyltransferase [Sanguibacter gelidistatuariae]
MVCVVFNPGDELRDFGRSLATASRRPIDLVFVNNGGPSAVANEVAASLGGRVLPSGGNLGYGGGANVGLATSASEWAVVANPDLVWEPGSLDVLLEAGEAEPRAGSLGPALLNTDGTVYPSARAIPSLRQGVGHALFGRVWANNPWSREYRREHEHASTQERPAGWLSGACLVLRRTALEEMGGFDESYFMFFEDLDLGERLRDAGWLNLYVPAARVTHVQGVSWKSKPELMIRAHHASAEQYLHRRYSRWYQAPLRAAISAGLWARETVEVRGARR